MSYRTNNLQSLTLPLEKFDLASLTDTKKFKEHLKGIPVIIAAHFDTIRQISDDIYLALMISYLSYLIRNKNLDYI